MATTSVLIIGAGATGLSLGGALTREGVRPVLLDKDAEVGGTWARRYERLHLHTARSLSGLAHYPIPRNQPRYLPKDALVRYLQDYARRFQLDIRHSTEAQHVEQQGDGWVVRTNQGELSAPIVVLATGLYQEPLIPTWPGMADFGGSSIHSADYRSGKDYAGQRVLVVGSGNTGSEIAADLAEQGAAFVALSIRTAPPIVPRDVFGVLPSQMAGMVMQYLPARLADAIGAFSSRKRFGDLTQFGMPPAAWQPYTDQRVPTIDVGFVGELKRGRVQIRPEIERFEAGRIIFFKDGRAEEYDAVVLATSYRPRVRPIIDLPGLLNAQGQPIFHRGERTPYRGLYFLGYTYTLRGHLFEARRTSILLAKHIAAELRSTYF